MLYDKYEMLVNTFLNLSIRQLKYMYVYLVTRLWSLKKRITTFSNFKQLKIIDCDKNKHLDIFNTKSLITIYSYDKIRTIKQHNGNII